jgi:outer membrane immunogenic protein
MLVYATGGLAYGEVKSSASYSLQGCLVLICAPGTIASLFSTGPTPAAGSTSSTRVGWTAGAGMEWMIDPRWSVKAEYLYYDLGTATYGLSPSTFTVLGVFSSTVNTTASAKFAGSIARVGLNYRFSYYDVPVARK